VLLLEGISKLAIDCFVNEGYQVRVRQRHIMYIVIHILMLHDIHVIYATCYMMGIGIISA
jgi:hypothetical protein